MRNMSSESLLAVCVVLLCLLLAPSTSVSDGWPPPAGEFYTNSWAVEVAGGRAVADDVATRHGFVNVGQAGSLKDIYHFIHAFSPSRSKRSLDEPHRSLVADPRVVFAEQQVAKRRVKRDYSTPNNAMWAKQWYLHRGNHHDMNIERAWEEGATGRGVVISILDDGIEHTHPDLHDNYDAMASYDFNDHDDDPFPRYDVTNENKHGTRCAGEVSARKDGGCGSGAAYLSSIGGVRMLDGSVTDVVESGSLHLNPQHIDIYSSSWGPSDNGQTVDGPGRLAKKAFSDGVSTGRGGLGSLFVWAAGNGGRDGDSCNCDGYAVSPFTISMGSVSQNDRFPWYAEVCSSTLSATYSSGSGSEKQIVSTDLHHRCTERHTGTSASAPLAAGIMALALEINRNLTWRDMQYLVVYASNPSFPTDGDFHSNGAGLSVSHKYGFGVLDAAAIVNRARWWINAPPRENCSISVDVSHIDKATQSSSLNVEIETSSCQITYLEHVQAITTLHLDRGNRKNLEILLQSPMGTRSILLPHRKHDYHKDGFNDWPFMTVHSWGENPRGEWVFTVNVDSLDLEVTLDKLTLVVYGTRETPRSVRNVPLECHPECVGGCAGDGAQFCDSCKHFRLEKTFECVLECPTGTYGDHHMCRSCPHLCSECSEGSSCLQCAEGAVKLVSGECSLSCDQSSYLAEGGSCRPCHHSCLECSGPAETDCSVCQSQFIKEDGKCVVPPNCQVAEYFDSRSLECRPCHESCAECVGKGVKECTECYSGFYLDDGVCVVVTSTSKQCDGGKYYHEESESCKPCTANCSKCTDDITCLSCDSDYFLWTERIEGTQLEISGCISDCPKGFHGDSTSSSCQSCPSYCSECDSHDKCTSCTLDFAVPLNGQCPQPCHDGEYFDFSTSHCLPCLGNCHTCRGPKTCLACDPNFYLISDTSCVSVCPEHLVEDKENRVCLSENCHESCLTCFGDEPDQCLTCPEGGKLMEHSCLEECPPHTYYDEAAMSCKHCHDSCQSCVGPSQDNCLRCPEDRVLNHFTCLSSCPENMFVLNNTECVACPANCAECSSAEKCSSCSNGYLLEENKCVKTCSQGFVKQNRECARCSPTCKTCSNLESCDTCQEGYFYYKLDHLCLAACPAGYFPQAGYCTECPAHCSECFGRGPTQCSLCTQGWAMEQTNYTCTPCCQSDLHDSKPCCDCIADSKTCVLVVPPPLNGDGVSHSASPNFHSTRLAVTLIMALFIGAVMVGIGLFYLATRLRQRTNTVSYAPLNSTKGDLAATLALIEDSESGSEAELFARVGNT